MTPRSWLCVLLATPAGWCAAQGLRGQDSVGSPGFDIGGYVETRLRHYDLNVDGAAYQTRYADEPRDALDRATALVRFRGGARSGPWSIRFQTLSEIEHTQVSHEAQSRIDELFVSWKPRSGFTLDAGKIALRWGRGYTWNPVAFVERPKDPTDPRLAREGYSLLTASVRHDFDGPLQSVTISPVLLPVTQNLNKDFGRPDHVNVAGRLQFDFLDTDLSVYFLNNGSRPGRFGFDLSHEARENLSIYGEWARVGTHEFRLVTAAGERYTRSEAATSYLVGVRYRPATRVQLLAELQHNGMGISADEFAEFATLAQEAILAGPGSTLMARARAADLGLYGRSKPMRDYLYLRAGYGAFPLSPSIRATVNLQDRSYSVAPELTYSGSGHWGVRLRYTFTGGNGGAEYGEKYYSRILDLRVHFHF